ncbi:MAG TPA: UDP-N-acetylmuramoyl-tripeptide--D-alanyl-D-alanine ligase [Bryobacteraceae bacterium]|jgi:UDP-N-acetylmuramoyl-tripeptide--D-alanyl-D-alanine ligase
MKFSLRQVAEFLELPANGDTTIAGWSVDSRSLQPGDLFFALRGINHDGHAYVGEVFRKGAVAVVVDQEVHGSAAPEGRILRVADSLQGLQRLASRARQSWGGRVVAVTGSAGKTTTKDLIADMLAEGFKTSKSEGNLNNHVGLPLSLLRLDESASVAVLEMGMNHGGEIRRLAEIARPETGVVTNVGWAHIEEFDSIEGIAAAKRELIEALPREGTAVLNADDPRVATFAERLPSRDRKGAVVFYGQSPEAGVRAEDVQYSSDGVKFRVDGVAFESSLMGRHGVSNLLAGIATAGVHGIAPGRLAARIKTFDVGKMRGKRFHHEGILVYNDCYNSNPDAARAMLDVLRDTPAKRRIAVLGEMLELGRWAEPLHRSIGDYAAESGINVLVGIRGAACHMLDAAKRAGLRADAAFFFEDPAEAGRLLRSLAEPGDAILFKGSRGVHVEEALQQFLGGAVGPLEGAPAEGGV